MKVARLLLDRGADVNKADKDGKAPLLRASSSDNVEVVRLLLDRGADVNKPGGHSLLDASTS